MKIRNILGLLTLGCILVFTSCKKGEQAGVPDHLKVIPANSAMVMSINAKQLVEKGGLNKYKDFNVYKRFHEEIAKYEPEITKLIDEFLNDTRSTGLNLDQIFAYFRIIDGYDMQSVLTFGVSDQSKVAKWIAQYHKATRVDEYELVEGNGYKAYRLDYRYILVWDKSKALLLNLMEHDEAAIASFESLLKIDEENSITANADFMECYNTQKDFTAWMPFKTINQLSGYDSSEIGTLSKISGEDWENASMDISINFTNDKAAISGSVWPSSLVEEYFSKHPILKDGLDKALLSYFPSDYLFVATTSLNVQEYYKLLVDNFNRAVEDLDENEEDDYDYYHHYPFGNLGYIANLRDLIASDDVAKVVNLFKGDVIANIFGFKEGMLPIPEFGIIVTINGEEAFNQLLTLIPESIKFTKTDSYYSYDIPQIMSIYAGQKGDLMYITNSKMALDNFFAQGFRDNLGTSSIAQSIKNSHLLYSLNLDISKYPVLVTTALREAMGRTEYNIFTNMIEPFSSCNLEYAGKNSTEFNVVLKSSKENSLKVILKTVDKYASEMFY